MVVVLGGFVVVVVLGGLEVLVDGRGFSVVVVVGASGSGRSKSIWRSRAVAFSGSLMPLNTYT